MLKKKNIGSKIKVSEYSSIYLFMFVLFLIGVIFGAVIVNSMSFIQKQDLYFYLHQFFGQVQEGSLLHEQDLFQSSFFYHFKYILLIFILGLSIIGIPIIWIFIFMKGIVIGFSVGFLVNQIGWFGLLMASASIAPQNIFVIPAYLIAGSFAMIFSLHLIRRLFVTKTYHQPIRKHFVQYSSVFLVVLVITLVASIVETFLSPHTMRLVVNWAF
ncbi:stage II sporulation protein M [Salirhabdus euzebyi]|uniref:Stage II sporulation protein M n=1 Tax=Salirhabdus euzebyi TaxID=394506 RepID=A0A841QAB5_9BACI|nr:stage II sporulation protein M [Salirhabdus euzebyi]MBB6455315.1 stage II sporulation protein M [Salirhabdus euzebyi]